MYFNSVFGTNSLEIVFKLYVHVYFALFDVVFYM